MYVSLCIKRLTETETKITIRCRDVVRGAGVHTSPDPGGLCDCVDGERRGWHCGSDAVLGRDAQRCDDDPDRTRCRHLCRLHRTRQPRLHDGHRQEPKRPSRRRTREGIDPMIRNDRLIPPLAENVVVSASVMFRCKIYRSLSVYKDRNIADQNNACGALSALAEPREIWGTYLSTF